jgi:hypothetical protein
MAGLFDPIVRGRLYELGKRRPVSSEKARRMLGWTPRPVEETVLDAARSLQAGDLAQAASLIEGPSQVSDFSVHESLPELIDPLILRLS